MNSLLELLKEGDLRSDGRANEVALKVIKNPELFDLLWEGLFEADKVVRGRTAHALEKVSRNKNVLFSNLADKIMYKALNDDIPMVKWHLAMLISNLKLSTSETSRAISTLLKLLDDPSIFVKTWSIYTLTILAMENPEKTQLIREKIAAHKHHKSVAVQNRVSKSLEVLDDGVDLPKWWSKKP